MPRISSFFGIDILMYFGDHPPPHFHARHGDEEAKVVIADGSILKGSLSPRALRLVREWLDEHRNELEGNFERVVNHEVPVKIEPLK